MDVNNQEVELKYKFHDVWLELKIFRDWLEKSPKIRRNCELAYCKICNCTIFAHKSDLIKHGNSEKHQKNKMKMGSDEDIENQIEITENAERAEEVKKADEVKDAEDVKVAEIVKKAENVKNAEISLCAFVVEHNLSIKANDRLVSLCKDIFPDSDIASNVASKRTKSSQITKKTVGNNFTKHLSEATTTLYSKLKEPGVFFSINMEETMDQSLTKQYTLTVAYMADETGVKHSFFDTFKVQPGPAINLYNALKNSIVSREIPLENLVGFSSGCNSVFSHLQKDCPDIAYIKFSCHTIHNAASKASLMLPTDVEDLLKNFGLHFSGIYGKQDSFKEFQEFFNVDIHKIASTSTRWLSVKECVDRVLKQYDTLQTYVRQLCVDNLLDDTYQAMFDTMKNPFTKAYMEFMSYILGVLIEFNLIFQKEIPLYKMKPVVEKLLKNIFLNFLTTDYVLQTPPFEIEYTDSIYHLPLDKIYVSAEASKIINDLKEVPDTEEKDIETFFQNTFNFYEELVTTVIKECGFRDELYDIITIVDPQVAQDYNTISLIRLWKRFPILKKFINVQALDNEWKRHALLNHHLEGLDPGMPAHDYWQTVFQLQYARGGQAYPNLYIAIKLLLVLPFFTTQVLNSHQTIEELSDSKGRLENAK